MTFYHRTGANAYAPVESWTYVVGARPVAVASSDVASGPAPLTVRFTGSASRDPDGVIASFAWSFGDGGTSSLADPAHTYAAAGAYTATLTATDNDGLTDSASIAITVNDPPPAVSMHVGDLDGSRTANKKGWTAKVAVTVHASAHAPVSGAVVTGRWSTGAVTSCTTNAKGACSTSAASLLAATSSVTFSVTGITRSGASYQPGDNHDVDNGTDGTTITVRK
jgi:PKD repeat protein